MAEDKRRMRGLRLFVMISLKTRSGLDDASPSSNAAACFAA